jgi:hypothetical protein
MAWSSGLTDKNWTSALSNKFDECIREVNATSGVGLSLRKHPRKHSCLGDLVKDPEMVADLKAATINRLNMWAHTDLGELQRQLETDPMALVLGGFVGPYHVILKKELHPARKFREGKFRNVKMNDFVNQMCERILEKEHKTALLAHHRERPLESELTYGISFEDQPALDFREVVDLLTKRHGQRTTSDCASWDNGASVYLVRGAAEVTIASLRDRAGHTYYRLANAIRVNARLLSYAICAIPSIDGRQTELFMNIEPGQVPSGTTLTTTINGKARAIASRLEGYPEGKFNGDDSIEFGFPKRPFLEKREVEIHGLKDGKNFSFSSHRYTHAGCELESWVKSLLNLTSKQPNPVLTKALLREIRHNSALEHLTAVEVLLAVANLELD